MLRRVLSSFIGKPFLSSTLLENPIKEKGLDTQVEIDVENGDDDVGSQPVGLNEDRSVEDAILTNMSDDIQAVHEESHFVSECDNSLETNDESVLANQQEETNLNLEFNYEAVFNNYDDMEQYVLAYVKMSNFEIVNSHYYFDSSVVAKVVGTTSGKECKLVKFGTFKCSQFRN